MSTKQENVNDEVKIKAEEEAKAKAEAEAKAKAEAEAKAKAEEEAKAKAEAEAKAKAEEEAKAKAEAEQKAKAEGVSLKVLVAFTDKYTKESYVVNDIINVSEERATELLADSRRLVEKN